MRILYIDIDTMRPDHLGCYGYDKNTSPHMDAIAKDSLIFDNYYTSDAPCLPSRTALFSGQFGIHTGVTNHGNVASQLKIDPQRDFKHRYEKDSLFGMLRTHGYYTCGITPFASRHSAWYFYAGFNEIHDTGKFGDESAHEILPIAQKWLNEKATDDNWYLHINFWDPHTPYRVPLDYKGELNNDKLPNWLTEEVFNEHYKQAGPHCAQEIGMYSDYENRDRFPRQMGRLDSLNDVKALYNGYDIGIKYADDAVGQIVKTLKDKGVYEDTMIIISSDHGETLGEFGIYAEHGLADQMTCRIPMILKYPGGTKGHVSGLHYHLDLVPTIADLINYKHKSKFWDGKSYANTILKGEDTSHDHLVISQMSHVVQRSVRFQDYLYMRTYHDGFHFFPKHMLFNLKKDPHEQNNVAEIEKPVKLQAESMLFNWVDDQMMKSDDKVDPLWTVLSEGGPFHANGNLKQYCEKHLTKTHRTEYIELYKKKHPKEFK